MVTRVRGQ